MVNHTLCSWYGLCQLYGVLLTYKLCKLVSLLLTNLQSYEQTELRSQDVHIIAVVNGKGGSAKTTTRSTLQIKQNLSYL